MTKRIQEMLIPKLLESTSICLKSRHVGISLTPLHITLSLRTLVNKMVAHNLHCSIIVILQMVLY